MSCPTCKQLECDCPSPTQGIFGGFSLVGGDYPGGSIVQNDEASFIVDCPPGIICAEGKYPIVVTISEGEVQIPYNCCFLPGFPITLRLPCSTGEIVRTIPADSTQAYILQVMRKMLSLCGQDKANKKGWGGIEYVVNVGNDQQQAGCPDGTLINVVGTIAGQGIGFDSSTKKLTIAAGIFSALAGPFEANTTIAAAKATANSQALSFLEGVVDKLIADGTIQCGYWNSAQSTTCPDGSTQTIPANTYFSTVSQADADNQALEALADACVTLCVPDLSSFVWTVTVGNGSGSGGFATVGPPNSSISTDSIGVGAFTCNASVTGNLTNGYIRFRQNGSLLYGIDAFTGTVNTTVPIVHLGGSLNFSLQVLGTGGNATIFLGS